MSPWAGRPPAGAKVSLLVLLLSVVCSRTGRSERAPEFALTKIEESDIKDDSGKEPIADDDADPEDLEVFYPTHQWQTLRPGQAVPAGSHVRLNLQTGDREARLPDRENGKSDTREEKRRRRLDKMDIDSNSFTSQELKKALAKMKESEKAERMAHEEEVRKKFRPIEQLKEEFEKLNVKMETDYEIMDKLISKFNSSASTLDEKVAALYDLEYYVHQVDNAKDFLSMGGLQLVIEGLNSTEPVLKEHAAFVLGAALSRNLPVLRSCTRGACALTVQANPYRLTKNPARVGETWQYHQPSSISAFSRSRDCSLSLDETRNESPGPVVIAAPHRLASPRLRPC
uniref:Nucleotide exchange factor SIL1 n=1 Tax=Anas zonorhyncha TaxID=75864 RepID=A0A8B9VED7_9AVES